jgi:hypothetical protein
MPRLANGGCVPFIAAPRVPEGVEPVWHLFVIRSQDREGLQQHLFGISLLDLLVSRFRVAKEIASLVVVAVSVPVTFVLTSRKG